MVRSLSILCFLILLVSLLTKLSSHPRVPKIFRILPVPFWCYFLPMLANAAGVLPRSDPLYPLLSQQLLPTCLVLLLIGTDIKALTRLGGKATALMLAGSGGTMLGGLLSFFLYRGWLPEGSWGAVGALTGSWIGGSANLLAVKEALAVPDQVVGPIILVDAAIAYGWMALLIWSSAWQEKWDVWRRHPPGVGCSGRLPAPAWPAALSEALRSSLAPLLAFARKQGGSGLRARLGLRLPSHPTPGGWLTSMGVLLAIVLSLAAQWVGQWLPTLGPAVNASTWTILLVTTATLCLSMTPLRRIGTAEISRWGTFLLFVLLASIGARADGGATLQTPVFLALGVTWILIHGFCMLLAGALLRAPLGLIATASQANIGGPISAPLVGGTFSPQLAGAGLLLAIPGNLLGTYLGLVTGLAARALSA